MQETIDEVYNDVVLPEPIMRLVTLFAQIGAGIALAFFSVTELTKEVSLYRKPNDSHE